MLWLAAAAGALVAVAVVVAKHQKPRLRSQLALAGGVDYEIFEAEIIEIEPLDPAETIDDGTADLLEELAHEGLFSKSF